MSDLSRKLKAVFFLCILSFGFILLPSHFVYSQDVDQGSYLDEALSFESRSDLEGTESNLRLPSVGEVLFRMIFFLLVVLGIMFVTFVFIQKFMKRGDTTPQPLDKNVIKVLCYRKVEMKKGIYLVDVLGKVLVIGSDIEGLNLITEITDPGMVAKARELTDVNTEVYQLNPFQGILDRFSGAEDEEAARYQRRDKQTRGLIHKIDEMRTRLMK